jgi:hypothetical protein
MDVPAAVLSRIACLRSELVRLLVFLLASSSFSCAIFFLTCLVRGEKHREYFVAYNQRTSDDINVYDPSSWHPSRTYERSAVLLSKASIPRHSINEGELPKWKRDSVEISSIRAACVCTAGISTLCSRSRREKRKQRHNLGCSRRRLNTVRSRPTVSSDRSSKT